ncbi:hypothetical protein [Streptomyces chattanoogensis]|uniref:hypothetical protein n=1 Tax=Streptomyces chattanoogensis TaxID=66876 RepID=UPI0036B7CC0B
MIAVSDVAHLLHAQGRAVAAAEERGLNTMLAESCGGSLLFPEERAAAGSRPGIHAGFVCMRGEHFQSNMRIWAQEMKDHPHRANFWSDQPYLNVLVLRGRLSFTPLPEPSVLAPPRYVLFNGTEDFRIGPETRLLHF